MKAPSDNATWLAEYDALVNRAGLVDLGSRTQIEVGGADRASFLHNLCTNEIRKLDVGEGCEAFLTTVQGKTLGHVFIFSQPDVLVIDTIAGQAEAILAHLDHYLVCEQVTLNDRSANRFELLLAGAEADRVLSNLAVGLIGVARLATAQATFS